MTLQGTLQPTQESCGERFRRAKNASNARGGDVALALP